MKTRNYVLKNCDRTIIKAFQATIFQVIFTFHDFQRKKWKKKSNFSSARQRDEKKKKQSKKCCLCVWRAEWAGRKIFGFFHTKSHEIYDHGTRLHTLCVRHDDDGDSFVNFFFFSFLFIISDCLRNVNYQQCTSNEQLKNETKKKKRIREKDTTFSSSRPHNLDIIICRTPMKLKWMMHIEKNTARERE